MCDMVSSGPFQTLVPFKELDKEINKHKTSKFKSKTGKKKKYSKEVS